MYGRVSCWVIQRATRFAVAGMMPSPWRGAKKLRFSRRTAKLALCWSERNTAKINYRTVLLERDKMYVQHMVPPRPPPSRRRGGSAPNHLTHNRCHHQKHAEHTHRRSADSTDYRLQITYYVHPVLGLLISIPLELFPLGWITHTTVQDSSRLPLFGYSLRFT
jgi:hypothetical protein